MRQVVTRVYLRDTSPNLKTAFLQAAEWDGAFLYVGRLVIPMSAVREFELPIVDPEPSTPAPAPIARKGPAKK